MKYYNKNLRRFSRDMRKQMTKAEVILWQHLRRHQVKGFLFTRQKPIGNYIVDFYCSKAKSEKEVHAGFSDEDTTAITSTDGTFSYSFAGNTIPALQISSGATLKDLKDAINSDSNNPGVEASIINDGTGNANAFHLVLTSKKSGSAFKIENISHTLDNFSSSFSFLSG